MVRQRVSGVGVLDKCAAVLDALDGGPLTLGELQVATGLTRATAHRLASALEVHDLVGRDGDGRFTLGTRFPPSLAAVAGPALEELRRATGESVQLYVARGGLRVCVAAMESPHSLRTIVPVGAELPMDKGSAATVLRDGVDWAESVEEREKGVASVSAAVRDGDGAVIAAVSVSGPVERTSRSPGKRYRAAVLAAARRVEQSRAR